MKTEEIMDIINTLLFVSGCGYAACLIMIVAAVAAGMKFDANVKTAIIRAAVKALILLKLWSL